MNRLVCDLWQSLPNDCKPNLGVIKEFNIICHCVPVTKFQFDEYVLFEFQIPIKKGLLDNGGVQIRWNDVMVNSVTSPHFIASVGDNNILKLEVANEMLTMREKDTWYTVA